MCTHAQWTRARTHTHTKWGSGEREERKVRGGGRERMLAAASVTKNTVVLIPSLLSKQRPTPLSPWGLSEARYP